MVVASIAESRTTSMANTATVDEAASSVWLGRWMVGVAVIYLLLFVNLASLILMPWRLLQLSPAFDAPLSSVAAQATISTLLMFGLDLAMIAAVLFWASRNSPEHVSFVWLVIGFELVRSIADDLYLLLFRDYIVETVHYGFSGLHVVIIVSGYLTNRSAMAIGGTST